MTGPRHRRNLMIAAGASAAILLRLSTFTSGSRLMRRTTFTTTSPFYYAAATIGLNHGWQSIYDLRLQQEALDALGSRIQIAELARFISPPPVAWLAVPLTLLPFQVAYEVWSALLLAALVWTWYSRRRRRPLALWSTWRQALAGCLSSMAAAGPA